MYRLEAKKNGTGAHFVYDCTRQDDKSNLHYEKDLPIEALEELQALIRKVNLAVCNGQSKRNSARGTFVQLHVEYVGGETITAYGEGGCAANISGFCVGEPFVDLFLTKLGKKEEALSSSLNSMHYSVSNFNVGIISSWYAGHDSEQWDDIILTLEHPTVTGEIKKGKVIISAERYGELERLIHRLHMRDWMNQSRKDTPVNDEEDFIGITLNFVDKQGSVNSNQVLPAEAADAFHELRVFLEETYLKYSK